LTIFGFILVYFFQQGIVGFFKASCLGMLAAVLLGFFLNKDQVTVKFSFPTAKKLLNYSIHFLSVFFLFQAVDIFDRWLIKEYLSLENVGIYAIATRVSGLFQITVASFGLAWAPHAFTIKDRQNAKHIFKKVFDLYVAVGLAIVACIVILRTELIAVFAPSYQAAYHVIAALLIFNFLMGLVYVLTIGIYIAKRTEFLTFAGVFAIITKVVLSLLLVKNMGLIGIVLGSIAQAIVWVGVQVYFSQKYYRVDYGYIRNPAIFFLLVVFILAVSWFDGNAWLSFTWRTVTKIIIIAMLGTGSFFYVKRNIPHIQVT